jgi:hypothetical protein
MVPWTILLSAIGIDIIANATNIVDAKLSLFFMTNSPYEVIPNKKRLSRRVKSIRRASLDKACSKQDSPDLSEFLQP